MTYLIRLDDACAGMDLTKWERCEEWLGRLNIQPLVACVPACADKNLMPCPQISDEQFWAKVSEWQQAGWEIAVHGYDHSLHDIDVDSQIFKINTISEFVGLSYIEQRTKLISAVECFRVRGIYPRTFVAPAHSLDEVTYDVLNTIDQIKVISDGFKLYPYCQRNIFHIPQQLWSWKWMPFGVWTICLHPTTMSIREIDEFFDGIRNKRKFKSFADFIDENLNKHFFLNFDMNTVRNIIKRIKG